MIDLETRTILDWISSQKSAMIALTERWANINSGSYNLEGLRHMRWEMAEAFVPLRGVNEVLPLEPLSQVNGKGETVTVPMAEALTIRKRPEAPLQVLLVGHMDTVYGIDHPFQKTVKLSEDILNGPGVADLKGGLAIMLYALMGLERSPWAGNIGWQVLLNPDEEIGSIASDPLLKQAAAGENARPCLRTVSCRRNHGRGTQRQRQLHAGGPGQGGACGPQSAGRA